MNFERVKVDSHQPSAACSGVQWQGTHDVIVVGFGGAGVTAALEASSNGADVAVVDHFSGGGATAISGNVVYAGGGTHVQKKAGIKDTIQDMFVYLQQETKGIVKDETLMRFCKESASNLKWLEHMGVRFRATHTLKKTSYPPSGVYLYHSGSETNPRYTRHARPAPRGHIAYGGFHLRATGHPDFYGPLKQSAIEQGITLYLQSKAYELIQDEDGKVIGVKLKQLVPGSKAETRFIKLSRKANKWYLYAPDLAEKWRQQADDIMGRHAVVHNLKARKGIILSTGGFIRNRSMVEKYAPRYLKGLPLGTSGCDGSGIALGESVGGVTKNMDRVTSWRFINPPLAWAQGLIVDTTGKRFVDETLYGAAIGDAMCLQANGKAWLVLNGKLRQKALTQLMPWRARAFQFIPALISMLFTSIKAETQEALAKKTGMDPAILQQTIEHYNSAANGMAKDAFGKPQKDMAVLEKGPWFAVDISLDNRTFPCPTLTLGGLSVDEETGEVLNEASKPIPGLYAAGRTAIGIASNAYVSGLSLADCVFSGRRAGAHAARNNH